MSTPNGPDLDERLAERRTPASAEMIGRHVVACLRGHGQLAAPVPLPTLHTSLRSGLAVAICTYRRPASLRRLLDSVAAQSRLPDEVIVIDASPDDETERAVCREPSQWGLGARLLYVRVTGPQRGLTRQRNLALGLAGVDLIAFFDDDIVLHSDCLHELEAVHRAAGKRPVGVGARIANEPARPSALWRIRRLLGIVPTLAPGRYCRSGISLPWGFLGPTGVVVEGDWLPGGASLWRTADAREVGFHEGFRGYSHGEDLEFSLRARARGPLLLAGKAEVEHLQDFAGRPDARAMAYFGALNSYHIHRTCLADRSRLDAAYFTYAYAMDTVVRALAVLLPGDRSARWRFVRGRVDFLLELARGRLPPTC